MRVTHNGFVLTMIAATSLTVLSHRALAMDVDAFDFVPAEPGINVVALYTTFAKRSTYTANGQARMDRDTKLDSMTELLKLAHYTEIGGYTIAPQVLIPYGHLYNGKLNGASLGSTKGFGDPILAAPFWFVKGPKKNLSLTPYIFFPGGSYDSDRALNVGENRWKLNLQGAFNYQVADDFHTQFTVDTTWYGTNNDATAGNRGKITQDNSYQAQAWLSYVPPLDKRWSFSTGYSRNWGGKQFLDGDSTGVATRAEQVRFEVGRSLTPTLHFQVLVQRDLEMEGGYKEDFRTTVRIFKAL